MRSSSERKSRPREGWMPSVAKKPADTMRPLTRSAVGAPGEVEVFVTVDCHRGKALAGPLPVEKIKVADRRLVHARVFLIDGDKLGRMGIRQRVEKHSIDY